MMHEIPSFADLMLLPGVIDRDATVTIKDDRIAIETSDPTKLLAALGGYPHVRLRIDEAGDVLVEAREAQHRRLLLVWPSGRSQGALLWERGFYSVVDASLMTSLIAAGCAVEGVECSLGESLVDALSRLRPVASDGLAHASR